MKDLLMMTIETPRTKLVTAGDRAFTAASPPLWNRLPYTLQAVDSFDTFKSRLKTYFFKNILIGFYLFHKHFLSILCILYHSVSFMNIMYHNLYTDKATTSSLPFHI